MEILILGGILAVVLLIAIVGYFLLQQRRSGTIKAVIAPRQSATRTSDEAEDGSGTDRGAT